MFEPFFTTKPIGEGTGLGLYVSYGLAEELGGQLEGANHAEGGAVFTLRLPLQEEAPDAMQGHVGKPRRMNLLWLQSGGCGGARSR